MSFFFMYSIVIALTDSSLVERAFYYRSKSIYPSRGAELSMNNGVSVRQFIHKPQQTNPPRLILITGCTGTGKSTFGMTVALDQGILKCISTDTIRQVMRTFKFEPELHRQSYSGKDDPVKQWMECCNVVQPSIDDLVKDCINRGVSLVLEGVHIVPTNHLIEKWKASGGIALGCVLVIKDAESHRDLIYKRGEITTKGSEGQMKAFSRIRLIQQEMIRRAKEYNWLQIEQRLEPEPLDMINDIIDKDLYNKSLLQSQVQRMNPVMVK
eukprot:gene6072-8361_t